VLAAPPVTAEPAHSAPTVLPEPSPQPLGLNLDPSDGSAPGTVIPDPAPVVPLSPEPILGTSLPEPTTLQSIPVHQSPVLVEPITPEGVAVPPADPILDASAAPVLGPIVETGSDRAAFGPMLGQVTELDVQPAPSLAVSESQAPDQGGAMIGLVRTTEVLLESRLEQDAAEGSSGSVAGQISVLAEGLVRLVSGLPGADAASAPAALKVLAAGLLQLVDGILGGEGEAPSLTIAPHVRAALESVAGELTRLLEGLLGGTSSPVPVENTPNAPAAPPAPSPVIPGAPSYAGTSFGGASGSSGGAFFVLLLGVSAMFSLLLRDGKFSWPSRELLKPSSALRPSLERPG
jgi:hypothetical protein